MYPVWILRELGGSQNSGRSMVVAPTQLYVYSVQCDWLGVTQRVARSVCVTCWPREAVLARC